MHAQKTSQTVASVSETSDHTDFFDRANLEVSENNEVSFQTDFTVPPKEETSTIFVIVIGLILCTIIAFIIRSRIKTNTLKLY